METNKSNDITSLGTVKRTQNDISSVNISKGENTDINFGYAPNKTQQDKINQEITNLQKDTDLSREQALDNILAGTPQITSPTLNIAPSKPDLQTTPTSKSFTTRDEIMSRLNLMDENFNYTDTYTNYINQGGSPLPGFEYAHQELLNQERYENIFKKVDDGTLSYDTALMEAYGKDILATMGYDVTSVAYWQNKFLNNDFSNPFQNNYLMAQVKQAAEEFHQSRLTSQYGHSQTKDTQLASMIGRDLEADEIQDLFGQNWSEQLKTLDDNDLLKAVHTNTLDKSLRLTQDSEGTYYYLHTDGELYKLDNQTGDGHARFTLNADNTIKDIEIGGTHIKSFTSGFANVFTGLAKLCTNIIQFTGEGLSMIWDQDFDIDNATSWADAIDNALADKANFLVDSGYVDFDESFSWKDATHMASSLAGTVVGTLTLGGIMGAVGTKGEALSTAQNSTKAQKVAGSLLKGTSQVFRWSTGAFGDYALGQSLPHVWGMRAGAAGTYAFKNILQDVQKMNNQRMLSDNPQKISDGQLFVRALETNAINFAVDLFISGGISDNQFQAYTGRNTLTKDATKQWNDYVQKYLTKDVSEEAINQACKSEAFKAFMKSSNHVIRLNTMADALGNYLTATISKQANINKDGTFSKLESGDFEFWKTKNLGTTFQSVFNAYWYSYRSQKKENGYNIAFNNIKKASTNITDIIQDKINKAKNPQEIQTLQAVKANYLADIKNSNQSTVEGKILEAMDKLSSNLSTDGSIPQVLKDAFSKAVDNDKISIYRDMYDAAYANYAASSLRAKVAGDTLHSNSGLLRGLVKNAYYGFKGDKAVKKSIEQQQISDIATMTGINNELTTLNKYLKFADNLDKITATHKDGSIKEVMRDKVDFNSGADMLQGSDNQKEIITRIINNHGLTEEDLTKTYFITLKNESERTEDYNTLKCAYDLAKTLGYTIVADEQTHTFGYRIEDGQDFIETTTKLQTLTNTMIGMLQNEDVSTRATLLQTAIENLEYKSESQKVSMLLNIVDQMRQNKILKNAKEAVSLINELKNLKDSEGNVLFKLDSYNISKMNNKQADELMSKYKSLNTVLTAMQVAKNKEKFSQTINMGDPEIRKAVETLIADSSISPEIKEELKREIQTDFFQSGGTSDFKTFVDYSIKSTFTDRVVSPDKVDKIGENPIADKDYIELYTKAMLGVTDADLKDNPKLENDIRKFSLKLLNDWQNVYKNSTVVEMRDNIVILNLDLIRGKYTNDLLRDVDNRYTNGVKDFDTKDFANKNQIAMELDAKTNLVASNMSPILVFDINDPANRRSFNNIMASLNHDIVLTGDLEKDRLTLNSNADIFGMNYYSGQRQVIKMPQAQINLQEILEQGWKNHYITINGKTIPLWDGTSGDMIEYTDANGSKTSKPDYITAVMNNIELKNISANINLKEVPVLGMLPFNPQKRYNQQTLASTIMRGTQELKLKVGKLAGKTEGYVENYPIKGITNIYEQDETLANFLAIDCLVDEIFEKKMSLPVGEIDYNTLVKEGIINTEDSFWITPTKSKKKNYLILKDYSDEAKQRMKEYILADDFNLYKILPLVGYKTEKDVPGRDFTTMYSNIQKDGSKTSTLERETLLKVVNYDFAWDNNERDFSRKFFEKFLDGSNNYNYNPIKGHNYKYETLEELDIESMDSSNKFFNSIKNSNDPYYILLNRYIEEINKQIKVSDNSAPEDWRLIKNEPEAIKILTEAEELTPEIIKQVQDLYSTDINFVASRRKEYTKHKQVYTGNSTQIAQGDMVVGNDPLAAALGSWRNVVFSRTDVDGVERGFIPTDVEIKDFYDEVQRIKADVDEGRFGLLNRYISAEFNLNPVMRILTSAGSNDGYFAIEDADEIAKAIAANYPEYIAGTTKEIKYNNGVDQLFKAIYGREADNAAKAILNQAKKLNEINNDIHKPIQEKKRVKADSPTQTLDSTIALASSAESPALTKQSNFTKAKLARELEKNRSIKWQKLPDETKAITDWAKFNEAYLERKSNDTLFEQAHAGNSIAYNFTNDYNEKGPQFSTINTTKKLAEDLKGMDGFDPKNSTVQRNLMESSITLNNIKHGNTIYTGETTEFAVIKNDGSLLDMETWGRANLSDMFDTVLNNKQDLIGSTVVYVKNQGLSDIGALDMSYKYIKEESDYKSFVNDLYQSWALDNMPALKKAFNTGDAESVFNLMYSTKPEKLTEIINALPRWTISEKEETKAIWDSIQPYWDGDKKTFYKVYKSALLDGNTFENNTAAYNAVTRLINETLNIEDGYSNASSQERMRIDTAVYGMVNTLLSKGQRDGWNSVRDTLKTDTDLVTLEYVKNYMNNSTEANAQVIKDMLKENPAKTMDVLKAFLITQNSTSAVDTLCRNRSLAELNTIRNSKKNYSKLVVGRHGETIDIDPVLKMIDSIKNNTENKSGYTTRIVFDSETTLDGSYRPLTIGMRIKKWNGQQWETEDLRIGVDYGEDPRALVKNQKIKEDNFFKTNSGYRSDIEWYEKCKDNSEALFMTPKQINELINGKIDPGKTLLIGHNSEASDVKWLSNVGIFNEELLNKVKQIDSIMIASTNLKDSKAKKVVSQQGLLEWFFGKQDNSAHGSLSDAIACDDLFDVLVTTQFNVNKLKTMEIKEIEDFANSVGIKMNKELYKQLDDVLISARNQNDLECFNRNFEISTDNVARVTQAYNFAMMRDYSKLIGEVLKASDNLIRLDVDSKNIIATNSWQKILPVLSYSMKNNSFNDALHAINEVTRDLNGDVSEPSILKTISSTEGISLIKNKLGINEDIDNIDTTNIKGLLSKDIYNNELINKKELETFDSLKNTYVFGTNMIKLMNASGIEDEEVKQLITDKFLTAFDFDNSIEDIDEFLNTRGSNFIQSKYDKQLYDILNNSFGNVKALFEIPVAGRYSLIQSFNAGTKFNNLLTGETVEADASMAIVSKAYFNKLMGSDSATEEYAKAGKDLYTDLLIHPADGNNKVLIRKLIVVDDDKEYVRIPETIAETMESRDFDGDHVVLLQPNMKAQGMMEEFSKNMYFAHNLQEETLQWLKDSGIASDKKKLATQQILKEVGRKQEVIDACRKADLAIQNDDAKLLAEATKAFEKAIASSELDKDKIRDLLWIKEFDTSFFETKKRTLKYINNPAITLSDKHRSHSAKVKQEINALMQSKINTYRIIDSATGQEQKELIMNTTAKHIGNAYTDMITNDIYASKVVTNYFDNIKPEQADEFGDFLRNAWQTNDITDHKTLSLKLNNFMDTCINGITDNLKSGNVDTAKAFYDAMLRGMENTAKENSNQRLTREMKSSDMLSLYKEQAEILRQKEEGVNWLNNLRQKQKYYMSAGSNVTADYKLSYVLNDALQSLESSNLTKYVDDFENLETCKTFVVTSGWQAGTDEIIYNNSTANKLNAWVTEAITIPSISAIAKIKDGNKERRLRAGDILKAGDTIVTSHKGQPAIVASTDAKVLGVDARNGQIILSTPDSLDEIKIVTTEGSKGPINSKYSFEDKDVTLVVNAASMSQDKLVTSSGVPVDTTPVTKILTDENGNKHTVTGYYIDDVVPTIVESTKNWKIKNGLASVIDKKNQYRIDLLHHCSDSRSVGGAAIMGGWYLYVDNDGNLVYDPTRVQNMVNDLSHPERQVQAHNILDAMQYYRMGYVLSSLDEKTLQSEFKTKMSKKDIIRNQLQDVRVLTEGYNSRINYFVNKYGVKTSDPVVAKLFSPAFKNLLLGEIQTSTDGVNIENIHSKRKIEDQSSLDRNNKSLKRMSLGKVDSPQLYDSNLKYRESFDDYKVSALDGLRYLFGDTISNQNLYDWTKRGILNKSFFIPNANISNGFKNTSMEYTQERNPLEIAHNRVGIEAKSATVHDPYYYNLYSDLGTAPELADEKYITTHPRNYSDMKLVQSIANGEIRYSNDMKVAHILHNLGKIKEGMTANDRIAAYSDSDEIFTISQMLPYYGINKDGELELLMTKPQEYSNTAKGLLKQIGGTVKDFNYAYKVFNNEEQNLDNLYNNLDRSTLDTKQAKYRQYQKDLDSTLSNIYDNLKMAVNPETGEVKEGIKASDVVRDTSKSKIVQPEVIKNKDKELIFERDPLLMSASGLKEDNAETMNIARAVKKLSSVASYISQDGLSALSDLEVTLNKSGMDENMFKDFTTARRILAIQEFMEKEDISPQMKSHLQTELDNTMEYFGITKDNYKDRMQEALVNASKHMDVVTKYETYIEKINNLAEQVRQETGEPVDCLSLYLSPYKSTNTEVNKANAYTTVKNILNIERRDPVKSTEMSMSFDFFDSSKAILQELSKMYSATSIRDTLTDPTLNLASNASLIDKTIELMSKAISEEKYPIYTKDQAKLAKYEETQEIVFDSMKEFIPPSLATKIGSDRNLSVVEQYHKAWQAVSDETEYWIQDFNNTYGKNLSTYTQFLDLANDNRNQDAAMKQAAKVVADLYEAKVICAQGIIESSPSFARQFTDYLTSLAGDGYSLVNAYGQKFERNSFLKPLTSTSMANLRDNVGIAYNSLDEASWNQFMLEKLMCGEVYLLDNKVADYLNNEVYTAKIGNNLTNTLKKISKMSSSLQMALPSKILNRIISFTGFDYGMGIAYDLKTIGNIGRARRELLAAFQSKGKNMTPEIAKYFELEGQPVGLTGKDLVTFTEDVSMGKKVDAVLNTLTDPLEFQNHLGRYAIYLTALEGFEKGDPNYGPVYSKKEAIDSLKTNEEKAMYIMDYVLGSPGGFPKLSKKTSGYMLYATFPMTFTRTLGAYAMSLGKLAKEGFTSENARQWMRTAGNPSLGIAGITMLGATITSLVCDLYGIEEDEKEKLLDKKVSIDPIGTLIGGTPTASSSAMNPLVNFEEMFITPFTENDTILKKLFGFTNQNVLSHLNPAIKTPIEIATGYDLYSSAPIDTKYYYTGTENAIRKVMGFFVGSSTGNAIVNQYKMDAYAEDSNFVDSLLTGLKRGVSSSIGNQKTYKKDTTNYYNNIYKINNYKYSTSDTYDAEVEDLLDANYLNSRRSSTGKYGSYDVDDYKRISNIMRKLINSKAEAATVYGTIVSEYNKGTSEATLRVVLNNCSLIRKLKQVDTQAYLQTLTPKERASLSQAIEYEERMYPFLDDMFPTNTTGYYKKNYKKNYYKKPYSSGSYIPYPRTYKPTYVKYYPNNGYSNKKYKSYKPGYNIDRVQVNVSPEMAVWSNDYNEVKDPERDLYYLNNPYYNNLSDYEKRQKGGN